MTLEKKKPKILRSFELTAENDKKIEDLKKKYQLSKTVIINEIIRDYKDVKKGGKNE